MEERIAGRVLLVDDEANFRRILGKVLQEAGFSVVTAASGNQALEVLDQERVDVIVTDLRMADGDGLTLLDEVQQRDPELAVIIVTAYGTFQTALNATSAGAFEYLTKPFDNADLVRKVKHAVERTRLVEERNLLSEQLDGQSGYGEIIGRSAVMQQVGRQIAQVAGSNSTVLVTGESGTGKELVARAIHRASPRTDKALVTVNCGAFPHELLENELFGHEKGSFTGAHSAQAGLVEQASGGTLFLDEIGELPLDLQPKILRVIETGDYRRVGGQGDRHSGLRVIAATNRKLADEVKAGRFRDDLFYRLATFPIHLPALRERREDIELLVDNLLRRGQKQGRTFRDIAPDALMRLQQYTWPGNVRELENVIERILISRNHSTIQVEDLPAEVSGGSESLAPTQRLGAMPYKQAKAFWERRYFLELLEDCQYNATRAALVAQLSRRHLQEKLREFHIRVGDLRVDEGEDEA